VFFAPVLSIEAYERFCGKAELYRLLEEGLADARDGKLLSMAEVFDL
jgi:hypothetical protein